MSSVALLCPSVAFGEGGAKEEASAVLSPKYSRRSCPPKLQRRRNEPAVLRLFFNSCSGCTAPAVLFPEYSGTFLLRFQSYGGQDGTAAPPLFVRITIYINTYLRGLVRPRELEVVTRTLKKSSHDK